MFVKNMLKDAVETARKGFDYVADTVKKHPWCFVATAMCLIIHLIILSENNNKDD